MHADDVAAALPAELPGLLRFARTLTRDGDRAQDLVQETAVRALERAESYRGDAPLGSWLRRILHNLAVDRGRRDHEIPAEDIAEQVEQRWRADDYTVDAAEVIARAETRADLEDALIHLPVIYRSAVLLHDAEGMTMARIADLQGVGLPAAKQRLRRGRMMLVSALAEGHERRAALAGVPLRCWDARQRVSDYLDGVLPLAEAGVLEKHLESCPTCPPLYVSLVSARDALGGLGRDARTRDPRTRDPRTRDPRDPDTVVPPDLAARLVQRAART